MLDNLRQHFEVILIVLFLLSSFAYILYRMTFYQAIKADLKTHAGQLKSLQKKERKNLRNNIFSRHLDRFSRKFIYFFADLFWVLLFVVVVRSFIVEPFIIPTGSMKPGLRISDIVIVNKYDKGLRLPITNTRLTQGQPIRRGDVLVFKYPNDPEISYIKRVIGMPGDKIYYDNRSQMVINGKAVKQTVKGKIKDTLTAQDLMSGKEELISTDFTLVEADLPGKPITIQYADRYPSQMAAREWVVPEGKYLTMGDNRDNSADGRSFGYLDDRLIIGKASRVLLNWNCLRGKGQCDRFLKKIQ